MKPTCLVEINVANAVNHFLYGLRVHKHPLPIFWCPVCEQPVEPVKPRRGTKRPHFRHVKKTKCLGPKSWH